MKSYLNQINSFGLTNLIKVPTRVNSEESTLNVYFHRPEKVTSSYVLLSNISDHFHFILSLKVVI